MRPTTVLIGALGGEGGGVLSGWLVDAAHHAGLWAQATSVPGVAQRTGATTYYLEMSPRAPGDTSAPVMALLPSPGNVDLLVASELLEAGRAAQSGMITPERTTVVASTHRLYAIAEKSAMGDGRFDTGRIVHTVRTLARQPVLGDIAAVAREAGAVISSVMFGAVAATGVLPLPLEAMRGAIERGGIAVAANLRGFEAGFGFARRALEGAGGAEAPAGAPAAGPASLDARVSALPGMLQAVVELGLARTRDYQGEAYAASYLERVERQLGQERLRVADHRGFALTAEVARLLAVWMTYEDVIRVADLKTRRARRERVRAEVRAKPGQPVVVTEFLKPGLEEWCAVLPPRLAASVRSSAARVGWVGRLGVAMHVKSTSVSGFLLLWLLARLRGWRPHTSRFAEEQTGIEAWLEQVGRALEHDYDLALEVAACASLIKGYGDTHARGRGSFEQIMARVDGLAAGSAPAPSLRRLREAALADPEGAALARALEPPEAAA